MAVVASKFIRSLNAEALLRLIFGLPLLFALGIALGLWEVGVWSAEQCLLLLFALGAGFAAALGLLAASTAERREESVSRTVGREVEKACSDLSAQLAESSERLAVMINESRDKAARVLERRANEIEQLLPELRKLAGNTGQIRRASESYTLGLQAAAEVFQTRLEELLRRLQAQTERASQTLQNLLKQVSSQALGEIVETRVQESVESLAGDALARALTKLQDPDHAFVGVINQVQDLFLWAGRLREQTAAVRREVDAVTDGLKTTAKELDRMLQSIQDTAGGNINGNT